MEHGKMLELYQNVLLILPLKELLDSSNLTALREKLELELECPLLQLWCSSVVAVV